MAEVLEKARIKTRRFQLPDMDRHAEWLLPRLQQAWPHLNDRALVGFMRGLINSNEFLFLCQPHAVALAQVIGTHTLSPKPIVQERFVWVQDRDNKEQIEQAAVLYERIKDWAKSLGADILIVEEMSDIPHETIKQRVGRIFQRQQQFARIS